MWIFYLDLSYCGPIFLCSSYYIEGGYFLSPEGNQRTSAKMVSIMKIIIWLSLLTQVQTLAAKSSHSHHTGLAGLWNQQEKKKREDQPGTATTWWSEDYSLPRRRRPVHNDLKP